MKKSVFTFALAALMLCFTACEKDENTSKDNQGNVTNEYTAMAVGTWAIADITLNDQAYEHECASITFDSNGRGRINVTNMQGHFEFNWTIEGKMLTITPSDMPKDASQSFSYTFEDMSATDWVANGNVIPTGENPIGNVRVSLKKGNDDAKTELMTGSWNVMEILDSAGSSLGEAEHSSMIAMMDEALGEVLNDHKHENNYFVWCIVDGKLFMVPRHGEAQWITIEKLAYDEMILDGLYFPAGDEMHGKVKIRCRK